MSTASYARRVSTLQGAFAAKCSITKLCNVSAVDVDPSRRSETRHPSAVRLSTLVLFATFGVVTEPTGLISSHSTKGRSPSRAPGSSGSWLNADAGR